MAEFLKSIQEQLVWATGGSWFEYIAVVASVAYVVLAAAKSVWCWPMALLSSAIYTAILWNQRLYQDAYLHIYYLLMAVYGLWVWTRRRESVESQVSEELPVVVWHWKIHLLGAVCVSAVALTLGYVFDTKTDADFAYWDSFTTWFAVFATFLVTRKVLENWIYWVVLDIIWAVIYWKKGLHVTSGLMVFYTIFAAYGFVNWYRSWRVETSSRLKM
ncbi:MAG: nicotinamide riboside transporter PnuC [Verrucomicrobiota bacterium]